MKNDQSSHFYLSVEFSNAHGRSNLTDEWRGPKGNHILNLHRNEFLMVLNKLTALSANGHE